MLEKIDIDNFNISSLLNFGNNNFISENKNVVNAFTNDPGF